MKHFAPSIRFALVALTAGLLLQPGPSEAQGVPKDAVPFKAEVTGGFQSLPTVPAEPPIVCFYMNLKGKSDLLGGDISYADTHYWQLAIDGGPATATSLAGVFTGPSGDALFIVWDAVPRPDGVLGGYGRFVVRGGRGKFLGATGSGTMISVFKGTDQVTQMYDGFVLVPKR
jgi:hypothetical protein